MSEEKFRDRVLAFLAEHAYQAGDAGSDPEAWRRTLHDHGFLGIAWLFWGGMWTLIWVAFAVQHTLKSRRA